MVWGATPVGFSPLCLKKKAVRTIWVPSPACPFYCHSNEGHKQSQWKRHCWSDQELRFRIWTRFPSLCPSLVGMILAGCPPVSFSVHAHWEHKSRLAGSRRADPGLQVYSHPGEPLISAYFICLRVFIPRPSSVNTPLRAAYNIRVEFESDVIYNFISFHTINTLLDLRNLKQFTKRMKQWNYQKIKIKNPVKSSYLNHSKNNWNLQWAKNQIRTHVKVLHVWIGFA